MAKKSSNGDGSIRQLPSGKWCAQVMDGYNLKGEKNLVYFSGISRQDVVDQIREYWKCRKAGLSPDGNIFFEDWADIWYKDYASQVQPSTYSGYRYTLQILKKYFGKSRMREIKALEINRFFDFMAQASYSRSYMNKCRSMLIQIFDTAEANEIITSNPARRSKIRRVVPGLEDQPSDNGKDAFTEEEVELLKKRLRDDLLGNSILLMIGTGMRAQEVLALTPADIAPDGSCITVNKAIKMVNGNPTLGPPKSERGRRTIPVPVDYRKHSVYLRYYGGKQYVWTSQRENGLFDVGVFRKQYYKALAEIPEVRKLSPHCCRHTYISALERNGVPMEQIARLAGHSNITTTDHYVHMDMNTLTNAVEVLNR